MGTASTAIQSAEAVSPLENLEDWPKTPRETAFLCVELGAENAYGCLLVEELNQILHLHRRVKLLVLPDSVRFDYLSYKTGSTLQSQLQKKSTQNGALDLVDAYPIRDSASRC